MKILRGALLVVALVVGLVCAVSAGEADKVEIRVANQSGYKFERVDVTFPSGKVEFGPVADGAMSAYHPVKTAYRYAEVDVLRDDGANIGVYPADYEGETPLAPGRYTYVLGLDGSVLTLELVKD